MSRNYKFYNPSGVYFVSFAVIEWINVFIRKEYKDILVESLRYCQQEKGMEIYAWCIMPTHVHLIFRSAKDEKPELLLASFKRFTSKAIVAAIKENPSEVRRDWLLQRFEEAGRKSSNVNRYQFWQHDNRPIELWSNAVINEKLNYIHYNPVEGGLAMKPEQYIYSSAISYSGKQGLLDVVLI